MSKLEMYRFKTRQFVVRAYIEADPDTDTSWDETGETAAKLASGEYEAFSTTVEVMTKTGMKLSQTTLCGSIYARPSDFFREHLALAAARAKGDCFGCYFPGMVREAVGEARTALARMPKIRDKPV